MPCAMDTGPGTRRSPSPRNAARTSSTSNHRASLISSSSRITGASGSPIAWKPTMSERGNGHGWLPT